jgi:hypothetical protein
MQIPAPLRRDPHCRRSAPPPSARTWSPHQGSAPGALPQFTGETPPGPCRTASWYVTRRPRSRTGRTLSSASTGVRRIVDRCQCRDGGSARAMGRVLLVKPPTRWTPAEADSPNAECDGDERPTTLGAARERSRIRAVGGGVTGNTPTFGVGIQGSIPCPPATWNDVQGSLNAVRQLLAASVATSWQRNRSAPDQRPRMNAAVRAAVPRSSVGRTRL